MTLLAGLWYAAWPCARRASRRSPLRWLSTIVLSILVIYAKESTIILVAAAYAYLVFARRDPHGVFAAVASVGCIVLALVPWAYRNKQVSGDWIYLADASRRRHLAV
ncbi:MAG: hypothetical protein R3E58_03640 [Phycisphaerae bacterium]